LGKRFLGKFLFDKFYFLVCTTKCGYQERLSRLLVEKLSLVFEENLVKEILFSSFSVVASGGKLVKEA